MKGSKNLPKSATADTMWKSLESYKTRTGLSKAMIQSALDISRAVRLATDEGGDIERITLLLQMQAAFTKMCKGDPREWVRLVSLECKRVHDDVYIQKSILHQAEFEELRQNDDVVE